MANIPPCGIGIKAPGGSHHGHRVFTGRGHTYRAFDGAAVCQATREVRQKRRSRCRGNLRIPARSCAKGMKSGRVAAYMMPR